MKRKNYKWKFAISICLCFLIPILGGFDLLLGLLFLFTSEDIIGDIVLTNLTILICIIVTFFVLVLIGARMFKLQHFKEDAEFFYQNKITLKKDNFKEVKYYQFFKIYCLIFHPKKENIFKSHTLKYYFYSYDEMLHFIFKKHIFGYFSDDDKSRLEWNEVARSVEYTESGYVIKKYPCPCCGNLTLNEPARGTYYICPVCYWEDDGEQYNHPDLTHGANRVSLNQARANYKEFGACTEDMIKYTRKPYSSEIE